MLFYQILGLYVTAVMNLTVDALMAGLMAIANAQIQILGCRISQLGHNGTQNKTEVYNEFRECVIFHNHNLR